MPGKLWCGGFPALLDQALEEVRRGSRAILDHDRARRAEAQHAVTSLEQAIHGRLRGEPTTVDEFRQSIDLCSECARGFIRDEPAMKCRDCDRPTERVLHDWPVD